MNLYDLAKTPASANISRLTFDVAGETFHVDIGSEWYLPRDHSFNGFICSEEPGEFFCCRAVFAGEKNTCFVVSRDAESAAETVAGYHYPRTKWTAVPASLTAIEFQYPKPKQYGENL